jgi:hypothetical protein
MSGQPGVVAQGVAQTVGTVLGTAVRYRLAGFAQHEKYIADALRAQS